MRAAQKPFAIFLSLTLVLTLGLPLLAFAEPEQTLPLLEELKDQVKDTPQDLPALPEEGAPIRTPESGEEDSGALEGDTAVANDTIQELTTGTPEEIAARATGDFESNPADYDLAVTGGEEGVDYTFDHTGKLLTIISEEALTISNAVSGTASESQIVIAENLNATITIENLSIDHSKKASACALAVRPSSSLNLSFSGNNFLKSAQNSAGLEVSGNASVVISSKDGSATHLLECTSGSGDTSSASAGIGGSNRDDSRDCGTVTINSGTIVAKSINGTGPGLPAGLGAGIGGAGNIDAKPNSGKFGGNGGIVTINGGVVTAWGGYYASGIGGGGGCRPDASAYVRAGTGGHGGTVTINGGTVDARSVQNIQGTASNNAPSIGSGHKGDPAAQDRNQGTLVITGGSVWRAGTGTAGYEAQSTNGAENVYPVAFTFKDGAIPLSNTTLVTAQTGMGNYGLNDVYTQETSGKVYFYLPESSTPTTVSTTADGNTYKSTPAVEVKAEYPCDLNQYNLYRVNHEPVDPPDPDTPISLDENLILTVTGSLENLNSITLGGINLPLAGIVDGFRYIMWPGQGGRYCGEVRAGENGTLQITLCKDYLATLKNGTFTLKVNFQDTFNNDVVESTVEVKFTVEQDSPDPGPTPTPLDPTPNPNPTPDTSDGLNLTILAFLMAVSLSAVLTSTTQTSRQPLRAAAQPTSWGHKPTRRTKTKGPRIRW